MIFYYVGMFQSGCEFPGSESITHPPQIVLPLWENSPLVPFEVLLFPLAGSSHHPHLRLCLWVVLLSWRILPWCFFPSAWSSSWGREQKAVEVEQGTQGYSTRP